MNQHPTIEQLMNYVEQPESATFRDIRLHIALCPQCRADVDEITHFNQIWPEVVLQSRENLIELPDYLLNLINQRDENSVVSIQEKLKSSPELIKPALTYTLNLINTNQLKASKDHNVPVKLESTKAYFSNMAKLIKKYDFKYPVWVNIPLIAAITAIVFGLSIIFQNDVDTNLLKIVAYQDNNKIEFSGEKQKVPGFGFFNQVVTNSKEFSNVQFELLNNNSISMSWPKVTNAKFYVLRVFSPSIPEQPLYESQLETNSMIIRNISLQKNQRYIWQLSGETHAEIQFKAQGGFVVY